MFVCVCVIICVCRFACVIRGVCARVCVQDNKTALYWAVEKGNATMVRDILQCNPDTETCTKVHNTQHTDRLYTCLQVCLTAAPCCYRTERHL